MIKVDVRAQIQGITKTLNDVQRRQIPFASMKAVNDTAFHVMNVQRSATRLYMHNPTPFTQRAPRVQRARNKARPTAWVYVHRDAEEYLQRLIEGGIEKPKKRALRSPTANTRTNRYGNIPRTFVTRTKGQPRRYFSGTPKGRSGDQHAGIWERYGRGRRKLRMVLYWDSEGRRVDESYPFYRIARQHGLRKFPGFFAKHLEHALRTAR